MAVNHPYTFGPSWKPAYISYSPDMLGPCKHSFVKVMLEPALAIGSGVHVPSGCSKCEHCGRLETDDWVHAWTLGLAE